MFAIKGEMLEKGPAIIDYYSTGVKSKETFYRKGNVNKEINYSQQGDKDYVTYKDNNKVHCTSGPALIYYHPDGSVMKEIYVQQDQKHRKKGPAFIQYSKDGKTLMEAYFTKDKWHRADGPAVTEYNEQTGEVITQHFYWFGEYLTEDEHTAKVSGATNKPEETEKTNA